MADEDDAPDNPPAMKSIPDRAVPQDKDESGPAADKDKAGSSDSEPETEDENDKDESESEAESVSEAEEEGSNPDLDSDADGSEESEPEPDPDQANSNSNPAAAQDEELEPDLDNMDLKSRRELHRTQNPENVKPKPKVTTTVKSPRKRPDSLDVNESTDKARISFLEDEVNYCRGRINNFDKETRFVLAQIKVIADWISSTSGKDIIAEHSACYRKHIRNHNSKEIEKIAESISNYPLPELDGGAENGRRHGKRISIKQEMDYEDFKDDDNDNSQDFLHDQGGPKRSSKESCTSDEEDRFSQNPGLYVTTDLYESDSPDEDSSRETKAAPNSGDQQQRQLHSSRKISKREPDSKRSKPLGRRPSSIWDHYSTSRDDQNKIVLNLCKICNVHISPKSERMKCHYQKCALLGVGRPPVESGGEDEDDDDDGEDPHDKSPNTPNDPSSTATANGNPTQTESTEGPGSALHEGRQLRSACRTNSKTVGKPRTSYWQFFRTTKDPGTNKIVSNICIRCNEHVSPKATRLLNHLKKCTKSNKHLRIKQRIKHELSPRPRRRRLDDDDNDDDEEEEEEEEEDVQDEQLDTSAKGSEDSVEAVLNSTSGSESEELDEGAGSSPVNAPSGEEEPSSATETNRKAGGKRRTSYWKLFKTTKDPKTNKITSNICKRCHEHVSPKAIRLLNHLKKCLGPDSDQIKSATKLVSVSKYNYRPRRGKVEVPSRQLTAIDFEPGSTEAEGRRAIYWNYFITIRDHTKKVISNNCKSCSKPVSPKSSRMKKHLTKCLGLNFTAASSLSSGEKRPKGGGGLTKKQDGLNKLEIMSYFDTQPHRAEVLEAAAESSIKLRESTVSTCKTCSVMMPSRFKCLVEHLAGCCPGNPIVTESLRILQRKSEHKPLTQCEECGKMLVGKLEKHMLIHLNLKPHQCEHCSKEFRRKEQLNLHILSVHKGIKIPRKRLSIFPRSIPGAGQGQSLPSSSSSSNVHSTNMNLNSPAVRAGSGSGSQLDMGLGLGSLSMNHPPLPIPTLSSMHAPYSFPGISDLIPHTHTHTHNPAIYNHPSNSNW